MFAVYTGTPGAGKTLNLIKDVIEANKEDQRQVYYFNIKECVVPNWIELTPEEFYKWFELPDGCILVVDECQKWWRSGTAGDKLPLYTTRIEDHRHKGIDIYATCQGPAQIHAQVKLLVNIHFHFKRPHGKEGFVRWEWDEIKANPTSESAQKTALRTTGNYDKEIFGLYLSASDHTHKNRFPKKYVYMLIGLIVVTLLAIGYAVYYLSTMGDDYVDAEARPEPMQEAQRSVFGQGSGSSERSGKGKKQEWTSEHVVKQLTPVIPNRPDSAPIYQDLWDAKDYPRPQVIRWETGDQKNVCRTYTQQGTRMNGVDAATCHHYQSEGFEFDFRQPTTKHREPLSDTPDVRRGVDQVDVSPIAPAQFRVIPYDGKPPSYPNHTNTFGMDKGGAIRTARESNELKPIDSGT